MNDKSKYVGLFPEIENPNEEVPNVEVANVEVANVEVSNVEVSNVEEVPLQRNKAEGRWLRDRNLDDPDCYRKKSKLEKNNKKNSSNVTKRAHVDGTWYQIDLSPNINAGHTLLTTRFTTAPPFTIFNARSNDWQNRKRTWKELGIKSELGRGDNIMMQNQKGLLSIMSEDKKGNKKKEEDISSEGFASGTSIFDPVLCETIYRWYTPENSIILDPFAGGSVRGIVAAWHKHEYIGIDLSREQLNANFEQWIEITQKFGKKDLITPYWIHGDSNEELDDINKEVDLIFSCPPYGDLEVYSNDPRDISNMPYEECLISYKSIIAKACSKLKNNRFACFVVGDFRNKKTGQMRNFELETIKFFEEAGLITYAKHILITVVGTLPIRVVKQFSKYRKPGMAHQYVLVFYKGENANENLVKDFSEDVGKVYK